MSRSLKIGLAIIIMAACAWVAIEMLPRAPAPRSFPWGEQSMLKEMGIIPPAATQELPWRHYAQGVLGTSFGWVAIKCLDWLYSVIKSFVSHFAMRRKPKVER